MVADVETTAGSPRVEADGAVMMGTIHHHHMIRGRHDKHTLSHEARRAEALRNIALKAGGPVSGQVPPLEQRQHMLQTRPVAVEQKNKCVNKSAAG
jgi:hypothetical protein